MMEGDLTLAAILRRAVELYPDRELVTRRPDGSLHRYTYREAYGRICQLAHALDDLGLETGDRVASVASNSYRHYELYFGPACSGRSLHTCNMLLPDEHFRYIVDDAGDRVVFVDPAFLEKVEANADGLETVERYVVLADAVQETDLEPVIAYEELLAGRPTEYEWPELEEDDECGLCYSSGTTGMPKGVAYSHRGLFLHSLACGHVDTLGVGQTDTVCPVVPMFHVNGWGLPYAATQAGAKQVFPGVHTDAESVAGLLETESVTLSAAVPTVWIGMAEHLRAHPEVDLSALDRLAVGGAAVPEDLIRTYEEEHDVPIIHAWGMTETGPVGTVSRLKEKLRSRPPDERYAYRATQGLPAPGIEARVRDEDGERVPWDGESIGEIEVRGPWVADSYHGASAADEGSFTDDGWLKTGDVARRYEEGYLELVDRKKDLIKSGGEWISSVALENELMAHDSVAEAAVVAVEHEKWQERPLACVVPAEAAEADPDELQDHLAEAFPDWWLPDRYETVDQIPRTSTGKFDKKVLRKRYWTVLESSGT